MQPDSVQTLKELRKLRLRKGRSQLNVAEQLKISQSTVSRRERKQPQRHSDATAKLCNYAAREGKRSQRVDRRALGKAIDEVCSKSDAHAVALSEIIEAFVALCRAERQDGREEKSG
jgi:transcriptional regulator with XRE-family HTH domain